jgi:Carboxypeptidase regulatory-like domain
MLAVSTGLREPVSVEGEERTMFARKALLVCLLVVAGAGWAGAQVRLAEVAGTVTDESGGVLPGVTITALHVDTGQSRTAITEAGGTHLVTALPVGRYRITAALQDFRSVVFETLRLEIGNSLRLDLEADRPVACCLRVAVDVHAAGGRIQGAPGTDRHDAGEADAEGQSAHPVHDEPLTLVERRPRVLVIEVEHVAR